jgi:hypothetical protein
MPRRASSKWSYGIHPDQPASIQEVWVTMLYLDVGEHQYYKGVSATLISKNSKKIFNVPEGRDGIVSLDFASIIGCNDNSRVAVLDIRDSGIQMHTRVVGFQELISFLKENVLEASLINDKVVSVRVLSERSIVRVIIDICIIVGRYVWVFSEFPIKAV